MTASKYDCLRCIVLRCCEEEPCVQFHFITWKKKGETKLRMFGTTLFETIEASNINIYPFSKQREEIVHISCIFSSFWRRTCVGTYFGPFLSPSLSSDLTSNFKLYFRPWNSIRSKLILEIMKETMFSRA